MKLFCYKIDYIIKGDIKLSLKITREKFKETYKTTYNKTLKFVIVRCNNIDFDLEEEIITKENGYGKLSIWIL